MYVCMYVCMHACMYVYMHARMYIVCIYIYRPKQRRVRVLSWVSMTMRDSSHEPVSRMWV